MIFTFDAKRENHLGIFDIQQSTIWKGLCSIIVIFVHFSPPHQNHIQMAVHSFGYIAVAIFFMLSGYGLRWSMEHKPNYLNEFFSNRIPSLMIPYFTANTLYVLLRSFSGKIHTPYQAASGIFFPGISFVYILLLFYVAFFAIYSMQTIDLQKKDILLSLFVVLYSAIGGFQVADFRWCTESLGFAYGVILFSKSTKMDPLITSTKMDPLITSKSLLKITLACLSSLLLGVAYIKYKHTGILGGYILRLILGASIVSFAILISHKFRFGNQIANFLGKISFETFLLHGLVMIFIDTLISSAYCPQISSGGFIAATIIGTLIISSIMHTINSFIIQKAKLGLAYISRSQRHFG